MTARRRVPKPPTKVTPTLYEACERIARVINGRSPDLGALQRRDVTALLAAVGWQVTLKQATDTPEHEQETLL